MKPFTLALLLLALSLSRVSAQPKAGQVQPNRIAFGTVYVGATVEGSFLMFVPGKNAGAQLTVAAPKFVKVLNKAVHTQQFGPGNDFVGGTVELALDTTVAGELSGEVKVKLGETSATVPVSARVKERRPRLTRLLLVETPFERYSTGNGAEFQPWTDLVKDASLDVSYLLVTRGKPVLRGLDLAKFECVLLSSCGLVDLTAADVKKVRAFAEEGGRVVVAADHFFVGTVKQANEILAGYGLQMRDEESSGGQTVAKEDIDPEAVKAGVASLQFFRASPVAVTDGKAARVLVKAVGVGGQGDGFVVAAKAGKGEVIGLGQSLWWNWIGTRAAGVDNRQLLRWLLRARRP